MEIKDYICAKDTADQTGTSLCHLSTKYKFWFTHKRKSGYFDPRRNSEVKNIINHCRKKWHFWSGNIVPHICNLACFCSICLQGGVLTLEDKRHQSHRLGESKSENHTLSILIIIDTQPKYAPKLGS